MEIDPTHGEPRRDPEEAGIILDRLAGELLRAASHSPEAINGLEEDARQFLLSLGPWLTNDASELAVTTQAIGPVVEPSVLARDLRDLADQLLDLAENDFNPSSIAAALEVLEAELGAELGGEDSAHALAQLRLELAIVVRRARAWAERHGFPVDRIPEPPPAGAPAEECVGSLRRLALVLHEIGAEAPNFRNPLSWTTDKEKAALLDLHEFVCAMNEVLRNLQALDATLRELHSRVVQLVATEGDIDRLEAILALGEHSLRANAASEQLVGALEQICSALKTWGVAEASDT